MGILREGQKSQQPAPRCQTLFLQGQQSDSEAIRPGQGAWEENQHEPEMKRCRTEVMLKTSIKNTNGCRAGKQRTKILAAIQEGSKLQNFGYRRDGQGQNPHCKAG